VCRNQLIIKIMTVEHSNVNLVGITILFHDKVSPLGGNFILILLSCHYYLFHLFVNQTFSFCN